MNKIKSPSFQFYAQDFLTGVMYLSNEEIGIYIKLLAKQWTDGAIPKKRVGLLVGLSFDDFSEELKEKFIEVDGKLLNERLENEREKKFKFLEKQRENGKKGGRPKKKEESQNNPTLNSGLTQKKPLEDEDEIEVEKENIIKNKKVVIFPFEDSEFKTQWQVWKDYKKDEFKFKYKSTASEQGALKKLSELSGLNSKKAIEIIHSSISNGWKGFFKLDEKKNTSISMEQTLINAAKNPIGSAWNN